MIQNASSKLCVKLASGNHAKQSVRNASKFKDLKANKTGLSYDLDATMRDGHHDMKTFGLGFLRSVSTTTEQTHTFASLRAPYSVLEDAFDRIDERSRASKFWKPFANDVRKANLLAIDLKSLGGNNIPTPAAARYVASIQRAAEDTYQNDPASRGDLLLGHAYVRYLADLFGGSMLGKPTRLALALEKQPVFYDFPPAIAANRMAYIESFYEALNVAGKGMDETRKMQIVDEAKLAFRHNAEIYKERPYLILGAIRGGGNILTGYLRERMRRQM
jgi:heme oxygenase (biliverdin-producing, ferredoxin)